jgi:hypothetical protein
MMMNETLIERAIQHLSFFEQENEERILALLIEEYAPT